MYFTYVLGWSNHQKYYYGVRYKETATLESLGTTYFSSSKYVKEFIEQNGKPDLIQIRKVFASAKLAKKCEDRALLVVMKHPNWLNRTNNNTFKNVVIDDQIKKSISNAKIGKKLGKFYNNGIDTKRFKEGVKIPDGWVLGKIFSEKQILHFSNLNKNLTTEKRKEMGKASSLKLTGRKKPSGFGDKISAATKGKPKPWNCGDNNPSKTEEARNKISTTKKGMKMINNGVENCFTKTDILPAGWEWGSYAKRK